MPAMAGRSRTPLWLAIPVLVHAALLLPLWFDAPIVDDYQVLLSGTMRLQDARSFGEFLQLLWAQQNEHRLVVTRAAAWVMAESLGRIDFRLLATLGVVSVAAILGLLWLEFRDRVDAALVGAAGFVLFQLTYYESSLTASAASSHIGVLACALGCFHFAMRPGRGHLAGGLALGILSAATQANGLLVAPLAMAACALRGQGIRATLFGAVAAILWLLYFSGYERPPHAVSQPGALLKPVETAQLFLVVIGGLAPGPWPATIFGTALLAALAWLSFDGSLKKRPSIALFVAFILLTAAAIAMSRVGFGVFWASRYAINSSCLASVVLLLLCANNSFGIARRAKELFVIAATGSLALSWAIWPYAADYSMRGHLLAKSVPDTPGLVHEPYVGVDFPRYDMAIGLLQEAASRGLYHARDLPVFAATTRSSSAPPPAPLGGRLETIEVTGSKVVAAGWADIAPTARGRVFVAHAPAAPSSARLELVPRSDIARSTRDRDMVYAGFRWEGRFDSESEAKRAAAGLCLVVEAPGYPPRTLAGTRPCTH
jgi:hypothetical protein